MRGFFIFLFFVPCALFLMSQGSGLNNALKMRLAEKDQNAQQIFTMLVQGDIAKLMPLQKDLGYTVNYYAGDIASITANVQGISRLLGQKLISYAELIAPHTSVMNDTMVVRNRIKPVKAGAPPLSQAYDGSGILIGIIDTGIDVSHPDFKDAQGNSRVKFLWEQAPVSGSSVPSPFNYGIEWTDAQINAGQCTHNAVPYFGHGTGVSGIAAGNGLGNGRNEGAAPRADLVVVALDFNKTGPTTADAVQYILSKATALGKPCVINASIGDYYGSHDATNLEAKLIENMIANIPGRVLVSAAGNGGHIRHHVKTQPAQADTAFTWITNASATLDYWFYADTAQVKNLKVSVGANRGNYSDLGRIGFKNHNYALTAVQVDTLKNNGNRIGIVKSSASINNYGVYELYLQILADTTGLLWRVETTGQGLHHAWNFDFVSAGLPSSGQYPKISSYVLPDTLYTVVSSFQCSEEVITVANYHNLRWYYDVNNVLHDFGPEAGTIGPTSSSGPTRDGRQKPDISASGNCIFSPMPLGLQASVIASTPSIVAQGGLHYRGGGTSAASPVVAGLAALYLQAHPQATNRQVKEAIINCAYSDIYTGANLPDYRWGHGKLDGMKTMTCGENLAGLAESGSEGQVRYFPNPFHHATTIDPGKNADGEIYVYSAEGKLLLKDKLTGGPYVLHADRLGENYSGLLLVRIVSGAGASTFKMVCE